MMLCVLGFIIYVVWAYCKLCVRLVESVCLSVTFAHCAQTAEDIDRISFVSPDRAKIGLVLHRSAPSSLIYATWPRYDMVSTICGSLI